MGILTYCAFLFKLQFYLDKLDQECISFASYSIIINEKPCGFFHLSRGLRKSDPISPFLFILCSEVLSRLIIREEHNGNLKGVKISKDDPTLSHLLFADDLILFGSTIAHNAQTFLDYLDHYSLWLGQNIHPRKSSIQLSGNSSPSTINFVKEVLNFKIFSSKIKYLGLPLNLDASNKSHYKELLDKIQDKLVGGKSKL